MTNMKNLNELILDKVRNLTFHGDDGKLLFRLTSLEDPSLQCTAEGEEIVDAFGSLITTLYRAKKATFSASNSLFSLDLVAAQYGTKKTVATSTEKVTDYAYEILTIADGKVTLKQKPTTVKYIYSIESGNVGTCYTVATTASETEFAYSNGEITTPTNLTGKIFVEYEYESENAIEIINNANEFPEMGSMIIYAYFRDKCNENTVYSGKIICSKAKLNPEQVELALTSTGKHPFDFTMMQDYCDETDTELFKIVVSQ